MFISSAGRNYFSLNLVKKKNFSTPESKTHGHRSFFIWIQAARGQRVVICKGPFVGTVFRKDLKGEVSRELDIISKAKNVCLSTETKKV